MGLLDFLSSIKIKNTYGVLLSGTTICGLNIIENGTCLANRYAVKSTGLSGATNGLNSTSNVVKLGGEITECTHLEGGYCFDIDAVRGFNVRTSGNTDMNIDAQQCGGFLIKSQCGSVNTFPDFTAAVGFLGHITEPNGFAIYDNRTGTGQTGIVYASDYSANYGPRSLVDKQYVDTIATGLNVHTAVRLATTSSITLSGNQTIDGVLTITDDRILVKNQGIGVTGSTANGIYVASAGAWSRASDYDGTPSGEVSNGDLIPITSGDTQNNSIWALTTLNPITVGTTPLIFSLFSTNIDIQAGQGIAISMVGSIHNVCVQLATNCGLTFCGSGLAVNPNIAGACLTYTNGVLAVCSGCFLAVGGTAVSATTAGNALALCGCTPACFLGATATANNSLALCGCTPACFLGATATANNSLALCGCTPACFLGATATATCASTAGNALALCGCTPACFLGATATATCASTAGNALALCGCTPACFAAASHSHGSLNNGGCLGATTACIVCTSTNGCLATISPASLTVGCASTAGNALALCGCVPTCFLGATATATCATTAGNALCLGGNLANTYAPLASPSFTTCTSSPLVCSTGRVVAAQGCGFQNVTYAIGVPNPIWAFSNAVTYGMAYYQGGALAIGDAIGFHFGNVASPPFYVGSAGFICSASCGSATDWIATSDCRVKTCIKPITCALSTVLKLQGVSYEMCCDETHENRIGLLAQDVEKILPEIVSHGKPSEDDAKYGITDEKLGLKYDKLTAVLIEAIKELDKKIHCLCTDLNYYINSNYKG